MVDLPFANPFGLWALLGVLGFIILYLRKPKPKDQIIPSLMFIMQDKKKSKNYSFLQKLMTNLLFLIQLFIILALALIWAAPFVQLRYDTTLENTVIVVDVSASMQAEENGKSRFDAAIIEAKKVTSGRNSIIMAENTPLIVLEDEGSDVAQDILGKIKPKGTTSNLGDALLLAKDILGDRPGRIIVFSDFIATEGPDIQVVRAAIAAEDKIVDFVDVSNSAKNTGIVSLEVNKYNSKVYVKNFADEAVTKQIKIIKDKKTVTETSVNIAPNSIENFLFDTPAGISEIRIEPGDSFKVDDVAYLGTPPKIRNNVLLITNKEDTNLEKALGAAKDVNLNVVNPPVLTINTKKQKIDPYKHDVIIVYNINNENKADGIVPGTITDLKNFVERGGSVVIAAQDDIQDINYRGLLNVDLRSKATNPTKVCVESVNQVTKSFEKERCFTTTGAYFYADANKGTITFASASDKNPLIVYGELKKGKVVYYGILDEASDFKSIPAYPVFWNSLINFLVGTEDIRDFNHQTGRIISINKQKVKTPSASLTTSKLILDEVGVYEYDGRKYAVNLLSEEESDVDILAKVERDERRQELDRESKLHDFNLELTILIIAFILLIFELFFVKRRGDF